jgi:hypothetical protein
MNERTKNIWKWTGAAVGAIAGGGVVTTTLVFALNAYIADAVNAKIAEQLAKVPTIETVTNQHGILNDGISDNVEAISKLEVSQDEFRLLFIEYLQKEAER